MSLGLCEPWPKDGFEVSYLFFSRFLLGSTPYVVERFILPRVYWQFGRVQPMSQGINVYARVHKERTYWGSLEFVIARAKFYSLPFYVWNLLVDVVVAGMIDEYTQYFMT